MSTTPTEIPIPASPRPVPAPWPASGATRPRPQLRIKVSPWMFAALAIILILSGYLGWRRLFPDAPIKDIQLYTVAPKSFPVILEEKGELKAANSIEIRCALEGKSTIINLADEGARVTKGQLLVELASDLIDSNIRDEEIKEGTSRAGLEAARQEQGILIDANGSTIRKAVLAVEIAQQALEKYKNGDAVQLRQDATLAFEKANSVLQRANDDFKDARELFDQGFITRIELEKYRFAAYEAKIEVTKGDLALKILDKYTIPMAMQQSQSAVTEATKDWERSQKAARASEAKAKSDVAGKQNELELILEKLGKLKEQKAKAKIVAPADGMVVYSRPDSWWRSDSQIQKGASVYERQALIELPDTTSMKVVLRVHEAQIEHLQVGLPATVEIAGSSNLQYTGTLSKIGVLADSQNRWLNPNLKEYETEVLLDGTFEDLKPGTTARVKVQIAQLNNVLAVPVQAVFGKGGKYYVFEEKESTSAPVEVQVGLSSNDYVEIKKGVSAGQVVRLAMTDDMKLMIPDTDSQDMAKRKKVHLPTSRPARRK